MKLNFLNQPPKEAKLIELIIIFNLVGMVGFIIPATQHIFMLLVPWHLLAMGVFMAIAHIKFDKGFLLFFAIVYTITFFAEWVGVHTNIFFGNYQYGHTMGLKLWNIPLIIGVTWFLLVYCAGVLMQRSRIRSILLRVIIGALILVLLDRLIEPVAMHFDYWHWTGGIVPTKNYWGWLMVSVVMLFVFELFRFKKQSPVAVVLLIMQFVFFGVLNFFI